MRRITSPSSRKPKDLCNWISSKAVRWLDSRTIVTPSARDLGQEKRVFIDSR
jgi:hypothetical protein